MTHDRELALTINWRSNAKVNFKSVENPTIRKINLSSQPNLGGSKNLSIYDCLTNFSQEETLQGNDEWYCSKCKEHVPAFKKIELYKTPEFLIIHLKRFSHTRNSMFGSRKVKISQICLSRFRVGPLDLGQLSGEFSVYHNELQIICLSLKLILCKTTRWI